MRGPALPPVALVAALAACIGDPVGPGVLAVTVEGAALDSVWIGAPGESLANPIRLRVTDGSGNAIPGSSILWTAVGRDAQVKGAVSISNAAGEASASWWLGTNAAQEQQLQVVVSIARHQTQITLRARAVPYIVSRLQVLVDTPAVVRLGDTLPIAVNAIDPFGNPFPAPVPIFSVTDSAIGAGTASGVVGGPHRGVSLVQVVSHGVVAAFRLHVTQYAQRITPALDTLQFSSLGADLPVAYEVRDDRGRLIADTAAILSTADTAIARINGTAVHSVRPGETDLHLTVGQASADVPVRIAQRVATLRFHRDTIRFDALDDTTTLHPVARDSLGFDVLSPTLDLSVTNPQVTRFASGRVLQSVAPGVDSVSVHDSATGISATALAVVHQRIATIGVSPSVIPFDALSDTVAITATPRDRLGTLVSGRTLEYATSDSTVAVPQSDARVRSAGPGRALILVRDPESGTVGQDTIIVNQIARALQVSVTYGHPVITLPVGAPLPLLCQASDRNGFAIARDAVLTSTLRGTITGTGCASARVQRSGYDTLTFAMNAVTARVAVIVATVPDSVGVVSAAQPLTTVVRDQFVGENLTNPLILALRPLIDDILTAYGSPVSNLDRARAIRDWVSRTAIHPWRALHPDTSRSNLTVLPPGATWADVNTAASPKEDLDTQFWGSVGLNGYAMLDRLLGTLDPATGVRAEDGMMEQVSGVRYRIRDVTSYHYVLCSYQDIMLNTLWAAAGLHGMLISTVGHDPAAVFIPEMGSWVYEDPEWDEEYLLDGTGQPLSPTDLLGLSSAGQASRLQPQKLQGPNFDPAPYITALSYLSDHANGMIIMGSQLNNRVVGIVGPFQWPTRYVQIDVPELATESPFNDPVKYDPVSASVAFPSLAPVVQAVAITDSVFVVHLSSTFPDFTAFQRRLNGGAWSSVTDVDVLPVGECTVEYRSLNADGNASGSAVLDVWAPRPAGFLEAGSPGSIRNQSTYCLAPF